MDGFFVGGYGMIQQNYEPQEFGRVLITTDAKEINDENVIRVLQDTYRVHLRNRERIKFLIEYEKGCQPIKDREKKVRPDINNKVCDNLANEIANWRLSYKWGNPITFAQRGDEDISGNDPKADNKAITLLNEMLSGESFSAKCVQAFYPMEVAGIGHMMVDIKKGARGSNAVFDIIPLDPLNTFVVYDNTVYKRPLMGVVYVETEDGNTHYTCLTPKKRYEILNQITIDNGEKKKSDWVFGNRSGEKNPMECVNIVEFERSYDRMGCFERQLSDLDSINLLVSDFTNNVAQDTQSIWWMNDADFPRDPKTGEQLKPVSGQWVQTFTGQGENKKPLIQPLVIKTDYTGILNNIKYRRDVVRQKCNVPVQASAGGGSTGTAMSMASGWETAETSAAMETEIVKATLMEVVDMVLTAIRKSPNTPADSELRDLTTSDIKPSVLRKKNYDMATKANTYATLVKNGIHPRHAMLFIEAFPDTNLVYTDSTPYLEKYYEKMWYIGPTQGASSGSRESDGTTLQDESMQASNSPFVGSMETTTGGRNEGGLTRSNDI